MGKMIRSTLPQVIGLAVIFAVSWGIAALIRHDPIGQVIIGLPLFILACACYVLVIQVTSKDKPPKS